MEIKKIDITSSVLEKGIDTAKSFLDKLIMPAIEETGLLLKDQVTMWKFKSQIRMLNKAKAYCERNNISPKTISLKLLCPLLDYSSIEEDELLHDKWAILLSNLVDSEQNIQNHVFPYILSQLSRSEFEALEAVYDTKLVRVEKINRELEEFKKSKPIKEKELNKMLAEIDEELVSLEEENPSAISITDWDQIQELHKRKRKLETQKFSLNSKESTFSYSLNKPETVPYNSLKDFELSNVIRLGLVKEEKEFYANSQTLEIPNRGDHYESYTNVDFEIDVQSNIDNILTELGELFMNACKEKGQKVQ